MKTVLILVLTIGAAIVSGRYADFEAQASSHPADPHPAQAQSQNNVGSIFGWGSHSNYGSGYGYGRPSTYGSHYGSNYGSNYGGNYNNRGYGGYGNKRPLNNHIYVKGPVFGSGSLRSAAGGADTVGSTQQIGDHTPDAVHHHHATTAGGPMMRTNAMQQHAQHHEPTLRMPMPDMSLPSDMFHQQHTQLTDHQHGVAPQHQLPSPAVPQHLEHPAQSRVASERHHEHHHSYSSGGVQCGQNVMVGCQPTVQEVPCASGPAQY